MPELVILPHVYAMRGFSQRLWGLIREPEPAASEAFWFPRCRNIHTLGMKGPIDIVGLDKRKVMQRVERHVCPGQFRVFKGCTSVLELASFSPWPFEQWLGQPLLFIRQGAPKSDVIHSNQAPDFAIAIAVSKRMPGNS